MFAEPAIDIAYDEQMPEELNSATFFSVEYLPGQYDQRADSAAQCIKLINAEANAAVKFARVIVLEGDVTPQQLEEIKNYCVNPVDSQIADNTKPQSLEMETVVPEDVKIIDGFIQKDAEALEGFRKEMEFAMSPDDIRVIQDYFKNEEKRDPSITELKVIDTYWSDHCRHTTFNTSLTDIRFDEGPY